MDFIEKLSFRHVTPISLTKGGFRFFRKDSKKLFILKMIVIVPAILGFTISIAEGNYFWMAIAMLVGSLPVLFREETEINTLDGYRKERLWFLGLKHAKTFDFRGIDHFSISKGWQFQSGSKSYGSQLWLHSLSDEKILIKHDPSKETVEEWGEELASAFNKTCLLANGEVLELHAREELDMHAEDDLLV